MSECLLIDGMLPQPRISPETYPIQNKLRKHSLRSVPFLCIPPHTVNSSLSHPFMITLRITTDKDQGQRITLPRITMKKDRLMTITNLTRITPIPTSCQRRIITYRRWNSMQHVFHFLFEYVAINHGLVGWLFYREVAAAARIV
mmetsp:Transcript_37118/g.44346  ORF Transcript_37118/g.44346 Transcript_37118/m.44346 type:complete len:144 (+) Transcript_37118:277-708(+)